MIQASICFVLLAGYTAAGIIITARWICRGRTIVSQAQSVFMWPWFMFRDVLHFIVHWTAGGLFGLFYKKEAIRKMQEVQKKSTAVEDAVTRTRW